MDDPDIDEPDMDAAPAASCRPGRGRLRRVARLARAMALPAALLLGAAIAVLAGITGLATLSTEASGGPGGSQAFFFWTALSASVGALLAVLGLREYVKARRDLADGAEDPEAVDQPLYDTVTGLPSSRLFKNMLQQALARAGRAEKLVALLLVDLEQIKVLSDQKGSASGASALRVLAARIKGCVRGTHTVARLAGDEFGVLLEGPKSLEEVTRTAEKIRQTVGLPLTLQGEEILINTNIGIALHRTDGKSAEELLHRAAEAKTAAKTQGQAFQIESSTIPFEGAERSRVHSMPFQS